MSGLYTFAVTNNLSFSNPPNPYALQAVVTPEPASLLLFGSGALALTQRYRRGKRRSQLG